MADIAYRVKKQEKSYDEGFEYYYIWECGDGCCSERMYEYESFPAGTIVVVSGYDNEIISPGLWRDETCYLRYDGINEDKLEKIG